MTLPNEELCSDINNLLIDTSKELKNSFDETEEIVYLNLLTTGNSIHYRI